MGCTSCCRSCCLAAVFLAVFYASILFCTLIITGLKPFHRHKNYQCGIVGDKRNTIAERHGPNAWILDGNEISPSKYPWVVSILDNNNSFRCSASIVAPRFVLTAGHCLCYRYEPGAECKEKLSDTPLLVINTSNVGRYPNINDPPPGMILARAKKWTLPDGYTNAAFSPSSTASVVDIALIELEKEIQFGNDGAGIQPVCLSEDFVEEEGQKVVAAGYGVNKGGDAAILREGITKMISFENCVNNISYYYNYSRIHSREDSLCTIGVSNPSNDTCRLRPIMQCDVNQTPASGDSGGPLQIVEAASGRWTQLGIMSWSADVTLQVLRPGTVAPFMYTRVSAYCQWLLEASGGEVECDYWKKG